MSYGYILSCFLLQGNGFQVASFMLFLCLRFEQFYISWPSHMPRGERENAKKVSRVVERKGKDRGFVLLVVWFFSTEVYVVLIFWVIKPCSSLEELY